uniref:hypothetical protein n=1 Tax=Bacteroides acidifaciens TaxID=85831 RepID=UPI003014BAE1
YIILPFFVVHDFLFLDLITDYSSYTVDRPTGCAFPAMFGAGQVVSVCPKHKLAPPNIVTSDLEQL